MLPKLNMRTIHDDLLMTIMVCNNGVYVIANNICLSLVILSCYFFISLLILLMFQDRFDW